MEPYIGQIRLLPYTRPLKGWMACAGQLLKIHENTALFSLLGNKFGGDQRTTFGLPNLQGKEPAPGLQYFIAIEGVFPPIG